MTTRRSLLTGLALAPIAAVPAQSATLSVDEAVEALTAALRAQHGGDWWTIVNIDVGLVAFNRA